MAAAGLTHGGFYRHFASKEDLAVTAAERLSVDGAKHWRAAADRARAQDRSGLRAILDAYLSEQHRGAVADGCAVAALGAEFARLDAAERRRVAASVETMLGALADEMPQDTPEERAAAALATYSAMVGALVLSRLGVGPGDGVGLLGWSPTSSQHPISGQNEPLCLSTPAPFQTTRNAGGGEEAQSLVLNLGDSEGVVRAVGLETTLLSDRS
jgi:AcrR family transcriptional regulator